MLTSRHFFRRQARHWFLCVLSTGQPPCNHTASVGRGQPRPRPPAHGALPAAAGGAGGRLLGVQGTAVPRGSVPQRAGPCQAVPGRATFSTRDSDCCAFPRGAPISCAPFSVPRSRIPPAMVQGWNRVQVGRRKASPAGWECCRLPFGQLWIVTHGGAAPLFPPAISTPTVAIPAPSLRIPLPSPVDCGPRPWAGGCAETPASARDPLGRGDLVRAEGSDTGP